MKDESGNGLVYVGDERTHSVYHMFVGGRVIFWVTIDNEDPELRIFAHRPDVTRNLRHSVQVPGHAAMSLYSYQVGPTEADFRVEEHIVSRSVQWYVYTQLASILFALYVEPALDQEDVEHAIMTRGTRSARLQPPIELHNITQRVGDET